METRPVFDNLSPLDHRYFQANKKQFTQLSNYLSERAVVQFCIDVEIAILQTHLELIGDGIRLDRLALDEVKKRVTPDAVYAEEETTRHNIRALVRVMKHHVPPEWRHLVHLGATSVDVLDTAQSMRIRGAVRSVILPLLGNLERKLIELAAAHAKTIQIGRTHGQHAVPITFGFAIAEYVSRLGQSITRIDELAGGLRGKISGAVGAYNSISLVASDPLAFERSVLAKLELEPADHSTQMLQPEPLLRLLLEINIAFGVVANLADDLRNLQRSEIGEVAEGFGSDQVGSSTMPQKRNPWNSEHVKSLWKTFAPRVVSFFSDQISEHQRDLTNSASMRFVSDYLAGFVAAVSRMNSILDNLEVRPEVMAKNATLTGDLPLAEAAYTLLARAGVSDAHEIVRKSTLEAESLGEPLVNILKKNTEAWTKVTEQLALVSVLSADEFFAASTNYSGRAAETTRAICKKYGSMFLPAGQAADE